MSIKDGFIKKAAEYGIKKEAALYLFKKANEELSPEVMEALEQLKGGLPGASAVGGAALGGIGGTGLGAALGMGIGGVGGLLNGTKDSQGRTHRLSNALKGAGMGGGLGAGLGFLGGTGAGGYLGHELGEEAQNALKLPH